VNTFRALTPAQAEHVQKLYRELIGLSRRAREAAQMRRAAYHQFVGIGFSDTAASELSEIYQRTEGTK